MSLAPYRWLGAIYTLIGLPGFVALVTGRLHRGGDPYFAMSFLAVPVGVLFLVYGLGRLPRSFATDTAVRLGFVALLQFAFMPMFWAIYQNGRLGFETGYRFLAVLGSFLSLVAFVLLIAVWIRGRSKEPGSRS